MFDVDAKLQLRSDLCATRTYDRGKIKIHMRALRTEVSKNESPLRVLITFGFFVVVQLKQYFLSTLGPLEQWLARWEG